MVILPYLLVHKVVTFDTLLRVKGLSEAGFQDGVNRISTLIDVVVLTTNMSLYADTVLIVGRPQG